MTTARHLIVTALMAAAFFAAPASAQVIFRSDFNTGTTPYTFVNDYDLRGQYTLARLATGGWNGTPAAHLVHIAGQRQYNMGWFFSGEDMRASNGLRSWATGDLVYVRLRLRYDDDFRWDGEGGMSNKMVDFGMGGDGSGRIILRQTKPSTTTCAPDPSRYGPTNGGITVGVGITYDCTPAAIITYGRWHHVQFAVQSSASTNGYIKVWLDNNNFAAPTSERRNLAISATEGGVGWNDSWTVGGFMTDAPSRTSGFVIDDFEVGLNFDPAWATGGSTPPPPTPPPPTPPPPTPPPPSGNTGLPWSASFDGGNFGEWSGGFRNTTGLSIVSAGCQSGQCARALLLAGTNSDNYADHYFGDYFSVGRDKVEAAWLKFSSKFDLGYLWPAEGQKLAILNLTNGSDNERHYQVYVKVGPNGNYLVDHSDIDNWRFWALPQNVGTPVGVRMGTWDTLKLYARLNTPGAADGVVRLWVNGVLKLEHTNVDIRANTSYGMNKLILSSWSTPGSGSAGLQWWDTWTLSTTDPDTGTTAPPSAPTNVRVE